MEINMKEEIIQAALNAFRTESDSLMATAQALDTEKFGEAVELLADKNSKDYASFAYLDDSDKEEKLFENQLLLKLPVCRNGKNAATCGLEVKIWEGWK